jgi:predicted Zn-dependent protease
MMRAAFDDISAYAMTQARAGEAIIVWYQGENSDFVRFNRGRVRQPGSVDQRAASIRLIRGARHASSGVTLSSDASLDRERVAAAVQALRAALPDLPDDPFLLYNTEPRSSERVDQQALPPSDEVVERILDGAERYDFVGLYAAGRIYRGFASSLGQKNWFERSSFNLDFSLYHQADKAVKSGYAGTRFDGGHLTARIDEAAAGLAVVSQPAKTIEPGAYRVYLAPAAVREILTVLAWGGFGLKSHRTKQTAFLKMTTEGARLSPAVTLCENTVDGTGPAFSASGFLKPDRVDLMRQGEYVGTLASPRSAKEYGVPTNGARDDEAPAALDLAAGDIPSREITERLGTGIYVNNLWYLNYSDKPAGRITGMTRFATFWVEGGRIVAPLNVMRFDETIYRMLGDQLVGLTRERDFILESETYGQRSTDCAWVPGALIGDMRFTL